MSSGSSHIDPIEIEEPRATPGERAAEERRRGSRRAAQMRSSRAEYLRPNIEMVRREAQELYRRRRLNGRQRSSGQQTEATPRPARVLVHGGHVTVLLRLLPRNAGHLEPDSGTTIRMRIDIPESPSTLAATLSADAINGPSANGGTNASTVLPRPSNPSS